MNKGHSLQDLLRDHSISAEEFLRTPSISSQIRSNLPRFVDYCRTHRDFIVRMIQLAFDISYQQLDTPETRTVSHTANDIFGNEETEVAELFFEPMQRPELETEPEPTPPVEKVVEGIQSEAERLFQFDSDDEDLPPQQPRPVEITADEIVTLSFQILRSPEPNETCLGHLQKMYSFFIRHEPIPVLSYFDTHPDMLQLLFKNIQHCSISSLLAQLLTSEDKNKEYKYESLKKTILERVVEEIFLRMEDHDFFDGAIVFLDEILSATKQSYYEYFEDFKRISNYLVSGPVLKLFYDELFKLNEASFCSAARFLESLFSRLNSEVEDNRYYHKEETEQSMNFEIDIFLTNVPALIQLTPRIQSFSSITRIYFLSFLDALLKTPQVKSSPPSLNDPSFISLFQAYKMQVNGGISKSKIYTLMGGLISRAEESQVKQFMETHQDIYDQYFTTIKNANYKNTRIYNKNQGAAFDLSLIAKLTRKEENALAVASKAIGKDLRRMCKKYDTRIASYQNSNSNSFAFEEESNFYQYNNENVKSGDDKGFNLTFVGKNGISIPTLHLPDRFQGLENKDKESGPKEPADELSDSPKEIVEFEEVISLTDKLNSLAHLDIGRVWSGEIEQAKTLGQEARPGVAGEEGEMRDEEEEERKVDDDIKMGVVLEVKEVPLPEPKVTNQLQEVPVEGVKEVKEAKQANQTKEAGKEAVGADRSSVGKVVKEDGEKARFFSRHLAIFA